MIRSNTLILLIVALMIGSLYMASMADEPMLQIQLQENGQ